MKEKNEETQKIHEENKSKKDDEVSADDKLRLTSLENEVKELRTKEEGIITDFGNKDATLRQIIDLALLSNNMLKGESLNSFIKRSTSILK